MAIEKIESIVPASGWWAGYTDDDGSPVFHRLAVFASVAVRDGAGTAPLVVGMDAIDLAEGGHAADHHNFVGYFHDSDFVVTGAELNERGLRRWRS